MFQLLENYLSQSLLPKALLLGSHRMKNQLLTIILHLPLLSYAQQHDMNNMPAKKTPVHSEQKNKNKTLSTTVRYDLYVRDTVVNFSGKEKHGIAINGSIPAPTLYFTEGDTAEIYVTTNWPQKLQHIGMVSSYQINLMVFLT